MATDSEFSGLHIDSDWKAEAQREKERLAQEEKTPAASAPRSASNPSGVTFFDVLNLLAMQAVVGLGGMAGPGGQRIPPNPELAQLHIDMLEVLREKTAGQLTDEEKRTLEAVQHELRMQYVELMSAINEQVTRAAQTPPTA